MLNEKTIKFGNDKDNTKQRNGKDSMASITQNRGMVLSFTVILRSE